MIRTTTAFAMATALLAAACTAEPPTRAPAASSPDEARAGAASPAAPRSPAPAPATAPVTATVPSQAKPGPAGTLPLAPGVYVLAGTDCRAPSNAGLRFYDGRGISGTATHDCVATVLSTDADTLRIEQSCIDAPRGDGPRTVEAQTITVHHAQAFTLATARGSAGFRRCADGEVPGYLRERAGLD